MVFNYDGTCPSLAAETAGRKVHFLMSIGNGACTKSKRDGHARAGREGERERISREEGGGGDESSIVVEPVCVCISMPVRVLLR